jgi:hypothetical protein
MKIGALKTACLNFGIVLFSVCITLVILPYIVYDLIFGDSSF